MAAKRQRGWTLRRMFPTTVMGQLIVSTILVQILVLAVFLVTEIRSQEHAQKDRDRARVLMQAKLLASLSSDAVARHDLQEMGRLTEAMRSSTAVFTARLTDLQGNPLAVNRIGAPEIDSLERAQLQSALHAENGTVFTRTAWTSEGVAPVMVQGKPAALAWIFANPVQANSGLEQVIRVSVMYALCALLANVFLVALLARTIVGPLTRLNRATQQVIRDTGDGEGFPLPVTTRNEAGQLTHSFNAMVRELQLQRSGLQETLALLDSMLENAPVGFAFFDRKHRYVRANHFLERMYGNTMHKHLGQTMQEIFPGPIADKLEETVEQVFETGEDVHDLELKGLLRTTDAPSDERTWICNFYPVKRANDRVRWVGMVMVEVTTRVRQEEAMRRSEKLAAAGRLAASIAHEINNPLESVTNLLYLLRQHPSLDAEAAEFAGMAQRELGRVSEITQQTLRFYRSSLKPEMVKMNEVVESVLTLHAARIHSAGVHVEKRLDPQAQLFGFAGELRQVMANLIGNAVDAMPHGGLLKLRVAKLRDGICVTVADTGSGMSPAIQRRIFEPFYTTKEATGTGLGLWVSAEIVAKHGGTIKVRSRVGEHSGTIFRIFFPGSTTGSDSTHAARVDAASV